jgi:hypothetical protein
MSELAVGSLKGLAANSFVIDVASGSKIVQPGAVLQMVSAAPTSGPTLNTTSFTSTNCSLTITPLSASSKIAIFYSSAYEIANSGATMFVTIFRGAVPGGTNLGDSTSGLGRQSTSVSSQNLGFSANIVDSPSTTSAITYTVAARSSSGLLYPGVVSIPQVLIAMEIAG